VTTKQDRRFLRSDRWAEWQEIETDQRKKIPPPPMQTPYPEDATLIPLPAAEDLNVGEMPVREAIGLRKSQRKYADSPFSLQELAFLLWATQGVQKIANDRINRTVPSAGARHPFETYLVINRVEGLVPGLYRYLSIEHSLCPLPAGPQLAVQVNEACYEQYVVQSAVTFIWTATPYRTEWRYDILSPKLIALDAGHVCQNLYLACTAVGAGACAIGAYDQEALDALLGLDGYDELVVYIATTGQVPD